MIKIDGFSIILLTQKMGKKIRIFFRKFANRNILDSFFLGGGCGISSLVDILNIYTTFGGYIMNFLYFTKWRLVQSDIRNPHIAPSWGVYCDIYPLFPEFEQSEITINSPQIGFLHH